MIVKDFSETSNQGMYKLTPEEGPAFFIRKEYLVKVDFDSIKVGESIENNYVDELLDAGLICAVEFKALSYLARAEQCFSGLKRKLIEKKFNEEYVGKALRYLAEKNYLSDERFSEAWLHDRKINHYEGRTKLQKELLARGIEKRIVNAAIENFFLENDELLICKKACEKFVRLGKRNEKLIAALLNAGFSYKMIKQVLEEEKSVGMDTLS